MTNQRLAELMKEHGLTDRYLASEFGVHHSIITRYRNDNTPINKAWVLVFNHYFGEKELPTLSR